MLRYDRMSRAIRAELTSFHPTDGAGLMVRCGAECRAAVLQRGADAVPALAYCRIGQADGMEVVLMALDAGAVDFDLDEVGVDAVDRCAESFVEHLATCSNSYGSTSLEPGFPAESVRNGSLG